jgi:hypothetical protein
MRWMSRLPTCWMWCRERCTPTSAASSPTVNNNGEPDDGTIRIIAIFVEALSLQVFPEEEDEPAADLLDVVQGEVYANLCSLFPHC